MKKILLFLAFSVLICGTTLCAFSQGQHPPAGVEAEHAKAEHEDGPLKIALRWGNFLILFGGLAYLLRKPAGEFFHGRRNDIAAGLQRAQEAQATAKARMDEIEQRLTELSADINALRSEAEHEARAEHEKIISEAKREVDRIVEQSRQEIERVGRDIEREIKETIADRVIDHAANTLRTEMTQDDQKRVVVRFIKKV